MENVYFELVKSQRESQKKFDYYFLAVIVTLLSLSIQSYKPNEFEYLNYLIVFVWLLLLISFLSGMYRQEKINISLLNEAEKQWMNDELEGIEQAIKSNTEIFKSTGEPWTTQEIQKEREKFKRLIAISANNISKSEKHAVNAYSIQKWTFVAALIIYSGLKIINL